MVVPAATAATLHVALPQTFGGLQFADTREKPYIFLPIQALYHVNIFSVKTSGHPPHVSPIWYSPSVTNLNS